MHTVLGFGRLLCNSVLRPRHQLPGESQYRSIQIKVSAGEAELTKRKAFLVIITRTHVHPLKKYW